MLSKKRTETPDLMGDLMAAGYEDKKQKARKPEKQQEEEPKIKATHYLRESTLFRLEQALTQLRIQTANRGLHRYDVVEEALQIALDELEQKGPESQLSQRLEKR